MTQSNKIILCVIGQLGIGGAEKQFSYLVRNLDRSIYTPIVCSLNEPLDLMEELERDGITVVPLLPKSKPDLFRLFGLISIGNKFKPSIIHSYLFTANFYSRLAGWFLNIPVIISERSSEINKEFPFRIIDRIMKPLAFCMIANSSSGAIIAINHNEIDAKNAFVIHNGIPITNNSCSLIPSKFICGLNIPANHKVIGIIGRLCDAKDHETFFKSILIAKQKFTNISILCIGDGPLRGRLQRLVRELQIDDIVIFTGTRNDIPDIMRILDILVLSSKYEGMPNVILEAMLANKPVISTNVGGVPEVVIDGVTGILVEPHDPTRLANAICKLLSDPILGKQMGDCGRQRVEKDFTIEKMVHETHKVYEYCLSKIPK
ncbi:MAG: glycosyltransferase [Anaerolineaceae bacterium]|nr:glycosyltransferase [Anaerolineaceae bacterium]